MRLQPGLPLLVLGAGVALAPGLSAAATAPEAEPRFGFSNRLDSLFAEAPALDPEILRLALTAHRNAREEGLLKRPEVLTIIDYSLPSTEPRLWVFDLENEELLYKELVAHGRGTGENWAEDFSNIEGSKQSSLGLFTTAGTYYGRNGYSLYLHGQEPGVNDQAFDRTIVMHGAWYVSEDFAEEHGRIGRSWGCPALPDAVSREVIDRIKGGSALFVYYPDDRWLQTSEFLTQPGRRP